MKNYEKLNEIISKIENIKLNLNYLKEIRKFENFGKLQKVIN